MAGESCDDEQTLLQPQSLPANRDSIDHRSLGLTASMSLSSNRCCQPFAICCQPAVSCCHRWQSWQLPVASVMLVLASTAMVVTLPVYLQAVNVSGSAYSGTLFVWLMVTALVATYCRVRYPLSFLRNSLSRAGVPRILRYGCWHGLACLAVVYALDRKRVLCHAQEPLMGLIVLYIILLYCFYRGPLLSSSKLLCLCGVLAGLFLAMDFQLNDIYLCRGQVRTAPASDGGPWSIQEHALWTVVYAGALFLYALAWIKLEHLLLHLDKHRASNDEVNTVSGQLVMSNATSPPHSPLLQPSSSVSLGVSPFPSIGGQQQWASAAAVGQVNVACDVAEGGADGGQEAVTSNRANSNGSCWREPVHQPSLAGSSASLCSSVSSSVSLFPAVGASHGFTRAKLDALLFWFVIATLATVLALFWTDFFTALGKSGSAEKFANLTANGLLCHFRGLQRCGPTALHGWALVLYMILFLRGVQALAVSSRSIIFPLSVASVSLPLSALFWGLFSEGGPYGIIWAPTVTGELVFSSFGLPVMVVCLIYWARLDRLELYKTSASALPRSTPPTRSHDYSATADRIHNSTSTPSNLANGAVRAYDRYRVTDTAVAALRSTMNTPTGHSSSNDPANSFEAAVCNPSRSIVVDIHDNCGAGEWPLGVDPTVNESCTGNTVQSILVSTSANGSIPGDAEALSAMNASLLENNGMKPTPGDAKVRGSRGTGRGEDSVVEFSDVS